jgi:arylsulfatase A
MTHSYPKKKWWLGLALLGLTLSQAQSQTPNIIVVFADDMGYGDVGCYNPESRIPTPNMDRLATQGIRFTDALVPPQ